LQEPKDITTHQAKPSQPPRLTDGHEAPEATSFFSQHGEDIIAWKTLAGSTGPRYFIEVGMIDGRRFSNTLAFEQRGWRGLCVEAHPGFIEYVRRHRSASTVVHAAAAGPDANGKTLPFYADPRGDLSSLNPRNEQEMKERFGHWFQGYDVVDVPVRTLDDMLYQAHAPQGIELVSIDIEGGEIDALRGLNLDYWQPRILVIEADDPEALSDLSKYLSPHGYRLARVVGVNAVYTRTRRDALRVRLARVDQRVLHTANPIDQTVDDAWIIPSAYETRSQFALRVARNFAKAA
jgi:FkbM family methyltransferase